MHGNTQQSSASGAQSGTIQALASERVKKEKLKMINTSHFDFGLKNKEYRISSA
ncbi:hypothetical protein [Candidatus Manganitrophus noduliformans]|uniref:hypothetical protein n=1 Tax=Candidatus Manganitrophus noduliformans TaxID=2606439 RepID=UPI00143C3B33|nr:hypothetical protein [Candidatus Manganitrophus noduliformans]